MKKRNLRYFKRKRNETYSLISPIIRQVTAKSIASDLLVVEPVKPSIDFLFDITKSNPMQEPIYHQIVTDENFHLIKKWLRTEDVLIGDTIEYWDDGGWEQLAGRAGISLMRDGKQIKSILTRMS